MIVHGWIAKIQVQELFRAACIISKLLGAKKAAVSRNSTKTLASVLGAGSDVGVAGEAVLVLVLGAGCPNQFQFKPHFRQADKYWGNNQGGGKRPAAAQEFKSCFLIHHYWHS